MIDYINLPMKRFVELTIKQLEDKKVVWFGSDVSFFGDWDRVINLIIVY